VGLPLDAEQFFAQVALAALVAIGLAFRGRGSRVVGLILGGLWSRRGC
jgi:hypothetical protein